MPTSVTIHQDENGATVITKEVDGKVDWVSTAASAVRPAVRLNPDEPAPARTRQGTRVTPADPTAEEAEMLGRSR